MNKLPKKLQKAVRVAQQNQRYPRFRLGSIVYKGGSILSKGESKLNTDPVLVPEGDLRLLRKLSVHAEIDALKQCGDPKGSTIYVARVGGNGHIGLARPCKSCRVQLKEAGVKRAIYTINDREYGILYLQSEG